MKKTYEPIPQPSIAELEETHLEFLKREPRDLFYRVSTELIRLIKTGATSLTLPDAIASLLQTWNKAHYRFNRFTLESYSRIESLVNEWRPRIDALSRRNYSESTVELIFHAFEIELGPVGASKCLHLLNPEFFPLWDRAIASRYGVPLSNKGNNAGLYLDFLKLTFDQASRLEAAYKGPNILKALDEYNYVTISLPEKAKSWKRPVKEAGAPKDKDAG